MRVRLTPIIACLALLTGCDGGAPNARQTLTVSSTTSFSDTGLAEVLFAPFEAEHNVTVKVTALGTGQALQLARRGDADLVLTHAPVLEQQFIDEGFSDERRPFMWNDFEIVGPAADPAGIADASDAAEALRRIAKSQSPFISRGDESGTHVKERDLWQRAGIEPTGNWYVESGSGQAQTLRLANERQAYALTDRGTFVSLRSDLELKLLYSGDPLLRNEYAVLVVSVKKHPHVKSALAEQLADYLLSPKAQNVIAGFGKDRFGEPLFFPIED